MLAPGPAATISRLTAVFHATGLVTARVHALENADAKLQVQDLALSPVATAQPAPRAVP